MNSIHNIIEASIAEAEAKCAIAWASFFAKWCAITKVTPPDEATEGLKRLFYEAYHAGSDDTAQTMVKLFTTTFNVMSLDTNRPQDTNK